jgi:membrane protease YdiL (CAAX protease family)
MRVYIKNKPAWLQLLIFGGITLVIGIVFTMFGFIIVAYANHMSLGALELNTEELSKPQYAGFVRGMLLVQFFSLFLLPSLAFAFLADTRPLAFAGLRRPDKYRYLFLGVLLILCAYLMVAWLGVVNEQLVQRLLGKSARQWIEKGESDVDSTLENVLTMKTPAELLRAIFLVGALAAFGEELFFRGILQRILIQLFRRPWLGILVTAAVFSAVHGQFLGFLPRWILGIILGYLYWYSGSLFTSMLGHFVFNSFQVILIYYGKMDINQSGNVSEWFLTLTGIAALLAVSALLLYMRRISVASYARIYETTQLPGGEGIAR